MSNLELAEALAQVIDPELGVDIVSLGLIYGITDEPQRVTVEMTMTAPGCPMGPSMIETASEVLRWLRPDAAIDIVPVFEPPWDVDMMTDEARAVLGLPAAAIRVSPEGRPGRG